VRQSTCTHWGLASHYKATTAIRGPPSMTSCNTNDLPKAPLPTLSAYDFGDKVLAHKLWGTQSSLEPTFSLTVTSVPA
jgi:hypothetical protein